MPEAGWSRGAAGDVDARCRRPSPTTVMPGVPVNAVTPRTGLLRRRPQPTRGRRHSSRPRLSAAPRWAPPAAVARPPGRSLSRDWPASAVARWARWPRDRPRVSQSPTSPGSVQLCPVADRRLCQPAAGGVPGRRGRPQPVTVARSSPSARDGRPVLASSPVADVAGRLRRTPAPAVPPRLSPPASRGARLAGPAAPPGRLPGWSATSRCLASVIRPMATRSCGRCAATSAMRIVLAWMSY